MKGSSISKEGWSLRVPTRGRSTLPLMSGEVVKGKVLEVLSDGDVSIRIKNRIIKAKTGIPLSKGDLLTLKVAIDTNEIRLRLVERTDGNRVLSTGILQSLVDSLKEPATNLHELMALKSFLERFPGSLSEGFPELAALKGFLPLITAVSGDTLHYFIESGGLFYESRLRGFLLPFLKGGRPEGSGERVRQPYMTEEHRTDNWYLEKGVRRLVERDLKGALLRARLVLGNSLLRKALIESNIEPGEMTKVIDKLLNQIEHYQLKSKLSGAVQTAMPFLWDGLKGGEIIIRGERGNNSGLGGGSCSCVINLDLERGGRLVVHILMQNGRFDISLSGDNSAFLHVVKEGIRVLEEGFAISGLKLGSVRIWHEDEVEFIDAVSGSLDVTV